MRYSKQFRQEQISRNQLAERFSEFGWLHSEPKDLGEDFVVHIYLQGQATGITFHVQLKSITNINKRINSGVLGYDFKMKDVLHWEGFSTPVVLIVWDINLREGRWAIVSNLIKELDTSRPNWRSNVKTVRLPIPDANITSDDGLFRLQHEIGSIFLPMIIPRGGMNVSVDFQFPKTVEGYEIYSNLTKSFTDGDPVSIPSSYIKNISLPKSVQRWFSQYDTDKFKLEISPLPPKESILCIIEIIGNDQKLATINNLDLKIVKAGSQSVTLSNKEQDSPFSIRVKLVKVAAKNNIQLNLSTHGYGRDISEAEQVIQVRKALALGGDLRLKFPQFTDALPSMKVHPQSDFAPDPFIIERIELMSRVQRLSSCFFTLPEGGIGDDDFVAANKYLQIKTSGSYRFYASEVSFGLLVEAIRSLIEIRKAGLPLRLRFVEASSQIDILGETIQMGPVTRVIIGDLEESIQELEGIASELKTGELGSIRFVDPQIVEIYPSAFVEEAERKVSWMRSKFDCGAVYLYGDLIWREVLSQETAISLAIDSCSKEIKDRISSEMTSLTEFPFEVSLLEDLEPELRSRIISEGKLLSSPPLKPE